MATMEPMVLWVLCMNLVGLMDAFSGCRTPVRKDSEFSMQP